jgi:hypothetical protein
LQLSLYPSPGSRTSVRQVYGGWEDERQSAGEPNRSAVRRRGGNEAWTTHRKRWACLAGKPPEDGLDTAYGLACPGPYTGLARQEAGRLRPAAPGFVHEGELNRASGDRRRDPGSPRVCPLTASTPAGFMQTGVCTPASSPPLGLGACALPFAMPGDGGCRYQLPQLRPSESRPRRPPHPLRRSSSRSTKARSRRAAALSGRRVVTSSSW